MSLWKREGPKKRLRIVLGTDDPGVLQALEQLKVEHQVVAEALTCEGLYRALGSPANSRGPKGVDLVIADLESLASRTLSPDGLRRILSSGAVPLVSPQEFADDPHAWQEAALAAKGFVAHLPSRCAVITGYSGGVGRTTTTLDSADLFALKTGLPTLVVEFCYGSSALRAICSRDLPGIYDCIADGERPGSWRKRVNLLPMDFSLAKMLEPEQIAAFLEQERRGHILTLVDAHRPHPLMRIEPDIWLVMSTTKPDALQNGLLLTRELRQDGLEVRLVNNMVRGKLGLVGFERDLDLPFLSSPERYDGRLGKDVLKLIYPHWK